MTHALPRSARGGITLDTGGLIAVDRGDRRLDLLLAGIRSAGQRVTIPSTALAQAVREPHRQARLARLTRHVMTDVVPLDRTDAIDVGRLLAASKTTDITDAHVVVCAQRADQPILTSDPEDLRALDPRATLITV